MSYEEEKKESPSPPEMVRGKTFKTVQTRSIFPVAKLAVLISRLE